MPIYTFHLPTYLAGAYCSMGSTFPFMLMTISIMILTTGADNSFLKIFLHILLLFNRNCFLFSYFPFQSVYIAETLKHPLHCNKMVHCQEKIHLLYILSKFHDACCLYEGAPKYKHKIHIGEIVIVHI